MTKAEFLMQLKERLQNFQQVLVRANTKEIATETMELNHFISEAKTISFESSTEDIAELSESVKQIYQQNYLMIKEGMEFYQLLIVRMFEGPSVTTYPNLNQSNIQYSSTGRRMIDTSI